MIDTFDEKAAGALASALNRASLGIDFNPYQIDGVWTVSGTLTIPGISDPTIWFPPFEPYIDLHGDVQSPHDEDALIGLFFRALARLGRTPTLSDEGGSWGLDTDHDSHGGYRNQTGGSLVDLLAYTLIDGELAASLLQEERSDV